MVGQTDRNVIGQEGTGRPSPRDSGAASLEYAGVLFVVVLLVGGVIGQATPVGGAIKSKICQALGVNCGAVAPAQAAADRAT